MEQLGFLHHVESYGRSSRGWFPSCLIDSQNQRMVEVGRDLRVCLLQPLLKQGQQKQGAQNPAPTALEDLQEGDLTVSLCRLCQCSIMHSTEGLPVFRQNLLCSSLFPLPLVLELGTTDKSLALSSLY